MVEHGLDMTVWEGESSTLRRSYISRKEVTSVPHERTAPYSGLKHRLKATDRIDIGGKETVYNHLVHHQQCICQGPQ